MIDFFMVLSLERRAQPHAVAQKVRLQEARAGARRSAGARQVRNVQPHLLVDRLFV